MGGQTHFLNLWRGEGTDYIAPAVAGSNPASGVSPVAQLAEQWQNIRAADSRHKEFPAW